MLLLSFTVSSSLQIPPSPYCWFLILLASPGDAGAEFPFSCLHCSTSLSSGLLPWHPVGSLPVSPCRWSARPGVPDWRMGSESYMAQGRVQESVKQIWVLQFKIPFAYMFTEKVIKIWLWLQGRDPSLVCSMSCIDCCLLVYSMIAWFYFFLIVNTTTIWG